MIVSISKRKKPVAIAEAFAAPVKKTVTDTFNRRSLNEGRNFGLGFAILNKASESEYKALMAFTACKDYLNDFVYVETTEKPLGSIYGFQHKYTGEFKGKDHFYLGLRAVHYNGGSIYAGFDKIKDLLKNNQANIIKFLNKLEEAFKVEGRSEVADYIEDGTLVIKAPIFWTTFPFVFSLYGLLIRCFLNVESGDYNVLELIQNKANTPICGDESLIRSINKDFTKFNVEKFLDYKYPAISPSYIHNFGIVGRMREVKWQ